MVSESFDLNILNQYFLAVLNIPLSVFLAKFMGMGIYGRNCCNKYLSDDASFWGTLDNIKKLLIIKQLELE